MIRIIDLIKEEEIGTEEEFFDGAQRFELQATYPYGRPINDIWDSFKKEEIFRPNFEKYYYIRLCFDVRWGTQIGIFFAEPDNWGPRGEVIEKPMVGPVGGDPVVGPPGPAWEKNLPAPDVINTTRFQPSGKYNYGPFKFDEVFGSPEPLGRYLGRPWPAPVEGEIPFDPKETYDPRYQPRAWENDSFDERQMWLESFGAMKVLVGIVGGAALLYWILSSLLLK